ncbi:C-type lectin lectoxin-Thr1-like, partial [Python bivittatus]|uniref:C-type lectin lectoxin-Thr1-like n=1 Tax=Python bivittatus TaxID=176946 RepID=A0A9F2WIH7_PYTBI
MGRFAFMLLGLLLVALPLSGIEAPNFCPSGWLTYNNYCYKIFLKAKNWTQAETFCRAQKTGCHLASIHALEESRQLAKYVSGFLSYRNVWIGLKDPKK